tara:strand:+ start:107 stop:760 length:654 start_codon:yes stop_codon:yes gene_type:complete
MLKCYGIDADDIWVFSSPESFKEYQNVHHQIVYSKNTILDTRNHIIEYFDEGEYIVEIDDDLEQIVDFENENSVLDLESLFLESFSLSNDGLWGFASTDNGYFSDKKDKYGCYSIVNSCCGYKNDKSIRLTLTEKEDFERVCLFYEKGKTILKRTRYGIKSKYWKNKGGIQDRYDFEKRKLVQEECCDKLVERWGHLGYKRVRKNGIADFRFKNNLN